MIFSQTQHLTPVHPVTPDNPVFPGTPVTPGNPVTPVTPNIPVHPILITSRSEDINAQGKTRTFTGLPTRF